MTVLKLIWVPFACAGLAVLFLLSGFANWDVGNLWGSSSVLVPAGTVPFIGVNLTSGHLWGSALVALGFFQFLVFGWFLQAARGGDLLAATVLVMACVTLTCLSFYTGIFWQSGNVDLMARQSEATQSSFNNVKVELTSLYQKTETIAPRAAAIIQAEIDQLVNQRISVRGKSYVLGKYTRNCEAVRIAAQAHCERFYKLAHELAVSRDYQASKSAIDHKTSVQNDLLVLDPNAGFEFMHQLTTINTTDQKTYRTILGQALVELFTLLGVSLMRWGIRYSLKPAPRHAEKQIQPARPDDALFDAFNHESKSVGELPHRLTVIEGGKTAAASKFAVCDDSSLIAFARYAGDTGHLRVFDFMDLYKAFCKERGIRPLGKNVIGTLLERCGGEKGRVTLLTAKGKQTYRKTWRLSLMGLKMQRAA